MNNITINFDMDGTIVNFYGVPNWLDSLIASDSTPYATALPLLRLSTLARKLNELQRKGYRLAIISWLSKSGTEEFNKEVTEVKREWLKKHMPSVQWDEIHIVPYGTPKGTFSHGSTDILFDDEKPNRDNWVGFAYDAQNIMEVLRNL